MPRVALAVIHGMGSQAPGYADGFVKLIRRRFEERLEGIPGASRALSVRVLLLSGILRTAQRDILRKVQKEHRLEWDFLRSFMADYVGDAIGYQRTERADIYRATHAVVARELSVLGEEAGPGAPLSIAAHSLGSVIISNYIWDLEHAIAPEEVKTQITSPAARLETLAHLYTMGSPLALWTLRFPRFGTPIRFPVPERPPVERPEWVNFFDDDDVIAYPLRNLSEAYAKAVTEDRQVQAGGWLWCWNPLSHLGYWTSQEVAGRIAYRLARDWLALNGGAGGTAEKAAHAVEAGPEPVRP